MFNTVLITGGTGKFGRAMLAHFLERGWQVVVTSRDQDRARDVIEAMSKKKDMAIGIEADFRISGSVVKLINDLAARQICVTHLVNNARDLGTLLVAEDGITERENFLGEFEMDVAVPYELTFEMARSSAHKLRSVVNVGSQYGLVAPNPALYEGTLNRSPVQYGVAKAALHHLTRELAVRLAQYGVRVNCVAYGGVEGRVDGAFTSRYASLVPAGRMLSSDEIPGPIEFLLSEASSAVNGHVLVADGGWSIW